MNSNLRILFMGTPDFAVGVLQTLMAKNLNVVAVITAADKPAGRGQKLQSSAVKKYAETQNIPVLQPTNLKDPAFIEALKALEIDLQIVVAFRMLPKVVWDLPKYGTFNLHASLLPDYRGAAPIHWAIMNGETKTGVTTFFLDEKIDTGAILLQKEIAIANNDTVGTLHDKLMHIGSDLVVETVQAISEGKIEAIIQTHEADLKTAYKLDKDFCKLDWSQDLNSVYNKIRGLNPFPAAWSILQNENERISTKFYAVEKEEAEHDLANGKIQLDGKILKIAVKGGFIIAKELQLAGKRKMEVSALLNGFNFNEDAKFI